MTSGLIGTTGAAGTFGHVPGLIRPVSVPARVVHGQPHQPGPEAVTLRAVGLLGMSGT